MSCICPSITLDRFWSVVLRPIFYSSPVETEMFLDPSETSSVSIWNDTV